MSDLEEVQRKRFAVLHRLYTETKGNVTALVQDAELFGAVGIPPDERLGMRMYLTKQGLIDSMGMQHIHITPAGIDYVEQRLSAEEKQAASDVDELTGLRRKGAYDTDLEREVGLARAKSQPLVLAVLDINKFKSVNDELGHEKGNDALRLVANAVLASVDRKGIAYRYGGDEFAIILPNTTEAEALPVFRRVVETVSKIEPLSPSHRLTISIGTALLDVADTLRTLFERADSAMYIAKREGVNQVRSAATLSA